MTRGFEHWAASKFAPASTIPRTLDSNKRRVKKIMAERTGGLRSCTKKQPSKPQTFGIETFAPPTNGPNFIVFWLFLATKMNLAWTVFTGWKKQNPHFALRQPMASTRHDVGVNWQSGAGSWKSTVWLVVWEANPSPCIDLNSVFFGFTGGKYSNQHEKHLDQTRQGDVSLERATADLRIELL